MSTLDADQLGCVEALGKAILHGSTQVIKAGAGSGKTHTIAHAISTYPGALAISHTRVACETLRERVLHPDCNVCILTIHAIANRLVGTRVAMSETDPESGIDYDLMLQRTIELLGDAAMALPEWLASRRYIVIDEFQDTGDAQNVLITLLRERLGCALAVVGDFAQSIYGFQGATAVHMHNLRMRSDCVDVTLRNNYRSHPLIVAHANRLSHSVNGGIPGAIEMLPIRAPASNRRHPLQIRCYRDDIALVQAITLWIRNRHAEGLLFEGDAITLYPSRDEARDYAHRALRLTTSSNGNRPPDGTVVRLCGARLTRGCPLPLGRILLDEYTDQTNLKGVVVHNPRRRLLVVCRRVSDKRQVLNQVYNALITKERRDPRTIFKTDRDNKAESNDDKALMRSTNTSLTTVHGAKGEEFDSVLHVDLGDGPHCAMDDDEEHRILYVSHTRAIDELWHVATCVPRKKTLTRYMTVDVTNHFVCRCESWETNETVPMILFDHTLIVPPETETEVISVSEVAKLTKTVWEPIEERPPVLEVLWRRTPKIPALPKHLYALNAAHGQLCEWICLWHMHETATRHNLSLFLTGILQQYSVNRKFAEAMQRVFHDGTRAEREDVRAKFDHLCRIEDASAQPLFDAVSNCLDRTSAVADRDRLSVRDVQTGMNNVRKQRSVQPNPTVDVCPVRHTIRHFDSHTGVDTWKLDDVPMLKRRVLDATRSVFRLLASASLHDKFVCLLFMLSVGMNKKGGGVIRMDADEQAWGVLVTVLCDDSMMQSYISYMHDQINTICSDALAVRETTDVIDYQTPARGHVVVAHNEIDLAASYVIVGAADATSRDGVVEVTSRDANYKTKVQQAHLYASLLDKPNVYNYYVEERMLVRRTRNEAADSFLGRSADDLLLNRGLPGSRQKIGRANLFAEWSISVRKDDEFFF